ncbi:hypothetical protein OG992_08325 [Micromonospora sp. NBC_00362]|uniref:hypothetical protein n=1 Tax=Micromonospora sp. NBC_00362 TaxID=2975975 RepID=UPI002252DE24|nr:hypothetical protein [Micromonospora sp. NBC_00362]MCX5117185.1 hypothetical protein [Micromonospora sp. NBC_00362]
MTLTALRTLLPVAALAGLAACTTPSPAPVAGASSTPPASTTPAPPATPSTAVTASPTRSTSSGTATPTACPVSAATLQRASGLSKALRIDPAHIKCARQWATAGVIAVDPGMQGDGVLLFKHSDGRWQKLGEGSALECTPFGIPAEIGDQVGCRDH